MVHIQKSKSKHSLSSHQSNTRFNSQIQQQILFLLPKPRIQFLSKNPNHQHYKLNQHINQKGGPKLSKEKHRKWPKFI